MRLDPETERRLLDTPHVVQGRPVGEILGDGIIGASGAAKAPPRRRRDAGATRRATLRLFGPQFGVTLTLPLVVVSEPNRREHWSRRYQRAQAAKATWYVSCAQHALKPAQFCLPLKVSLLRCGGPGRLDDDNLAAAFKHLRDAIATWFGVDDGGSLLVWDYAQVPWPNRRGVLVSLTEVGEP